MLSESENAKCLLWNPGFFVGLMANNKLKAISQNSVSMVMSAKQQVPFYNR